MQYKQHSGEATLTGKYQSTEKMGMKTPEALLGSIYFPRSSATGENL